MSSTALPPPQLTVRAIVLAIILAMVLAAANTYLGLFAGLTDRLRDPRRGGLDGRAARARRGGTILENNIVQTGASAGSSIASGVIFTVPALVILGHWTDFRYAWVLAIAGLGGILGVLLLGTAAPLPDRRAEPQVPGGRGGRRGPARRARTRVKA